MLFIRISDLFIKRGIFILVCLLIFNVIKLKAQARNCGTMIYFEEQKKNNPTLEKRIKDNEVKLQNWIKSKFLKKMHILGLGDYDVKNVQIMDDPCPVLEDKKNMTSD